MHVNEYIRLFIQYNLLIYVSTTCIGYLQYTDMNNVPFGLRKLNGVWQHDVYISSHYNLQAHA
jgi:hypothetical protein